MKRKVSIKKWLDDLANNTPNESQFKKLKLYKRGKNELGKKKNKEAMENVR
jgi:hypothetical protein